VNYLGFCTDIVRATFVHEDSARVRGYIRQKLNNADKVMKRKLAIKVAKESVDGADGRVECAISDGEASL
jgi:hypothetical protein